MSTAVRRFAYALPLVFLAALCVLLYFNGKRERAALMDRIITAGRTVEIAPSVFEREYVDIADQDVDLESLSEHAGSLARLLEESNRRVFALSEIVLTQRKELKARATATQGEEPASLPEDPPRRRVDFSAELSRFEVSGHTLTDPPEAFLTLREVRPLRLAVAVSRTESGRWVADVKTEDGTTADVSLAVVDTSVVRPSWREKISLGVSAGLYPQQSVGVSLTYGGRIALGPSCVVADGLSSCGVSVVWRPFK